MWLAQPERPSVWSDRGSRKERLPGAPRSCPYRDDDDARVESASRGRLAGGLQRYSPEWRDSDLYRLSSEVMAEAERQILAATAAAVADRTRPDPRTGGLREIRIADRSGREIVKWGGNPLTWMRTFMSPGQAVRRFRNPASGATLRPARRTIG
jgi:hypothetical protein